VKVTVHIVVAVQGGCVNELAATLDSAAAQAKYQRLCEEYGFDPTHAEPCENDVGMITVTFDTDAPAVQQEVEVFELDE